MTASRPAPAPLDRPKLARFIWDRDLDYRRAAAHLGRSKEWVRLVCLPFSDPRRRVPDSADMQRIHAWTQGEVTPADFYPAELSAGVEAANDEPAIGEASR